MAQKKIPVSRGLLSGLGVSMLAGLNDLGETLAITQITPETFEVDLNAFDNSANVYNTGRSNLQTASNAFKAAMVDLKVYLDGSRRALTISFGTTWNAMWAQAGFTQPKTAIPGRANDQIALALALVKFFTQHPTYEVAAKNVTAARGAVVRTAAVTAQNAVLTQKVTLRTAEMALTTAQQTLVAAMRALIKILAATLTANDPRWEAFGLNIPATKATPGQVQNVNLSLAADESVMVQWEATPLATRYRVRMLIVGVETKYRLVATSTELVAMVPGVQPDVTVQCIVQAVNGAQGVASEPVIFTVPPVAAPAAKPAPVITEAELAPLAAIVPNGNGTVSANGNGSRNGSAYSRLS